MERLTSRQAVCMMVMFLVGSAVITGGSFEAKQDVWISVIVGIAVALPLIFMYARILKLYPQKDIFDIFYIVFGKVIGFVMTLIITLYALQLAALVLRNFETFIQVSSLPETPKTFVALLMGFICLWTLKYPITLLGRGSVIVLPLVVGVVFLTTLLSIKAMDISYIKPVGAESMTNIFSSALAYTTFPFGELVLFLAVLKDLGNKGNPYRIFLKATLYGGFILLVAVVRNILVLGMPTISLMNFPSYQAVTIIDILDFITRIEVGVGGNFMAAGLVKITVCLYVASKGIAKLFQLEDHKKIVSSLSILAAALSGFVFKNAMQMFDMIAVYKYYAIPFQVVIPAITWIVAEIKHKKTKNKEKQSEYIGIKEKAKA